MPDIKEITNIIGEIWLDTCKDNENLVEILNFVVSNKLANKEKLCATIQEIRFSEQKEMKNSSAFLEWSK